MEHLFRELSGETNRVVHSWNGFFLAFQLPADEGARLFVLGISAPKETGRGTAFQKVGAEARSLEKDELHIRQGEEFLHHLPSDTVAGRFYKLESRLRCGTILWRSSARPPGTLAPVISFVQQGEHDCSCLLLGCHEEEEEVQVGLFQASVAQHSICSHSLTLESVHMAFFGQQNELEVTVCPSWEPRTQMSCAFPLALPPSCHHHERTCRASLLG